MMFNHRRRSGQSGRRAAAALLLCASLAWTTAGLAAQARPGPAGRQGARGGQAGDDANVSPAEIQRMLDGYLLIQAQDVLQLTDEQFPAFLSRVRAWQEIRRRLQGERLRLLQDLRRMTAGRGAPADEAAIAAGLAALDEHDARAAGQIRQSRGAIDELLSPVQRARFRVFEETMEQRRLELLMRARQGRGRANQPDPRN